MIKPIFHTILVLFICLLGVSTMNAQDIHYSQFYQSPLMLNPSLTGHIPGKYRINAMYRRQWPTITSGRPVYETPMIGFDMNLLRTENRFNSLGLGIALMNDRNSGGLLNNIEVMGSIAYHLDLKKNMKTYLSAGLQAGVINKRLDAEGILFPNEIDEEGMETLPSNEVFDNTSIWLPDFRLGLTFSGFPSAKTRYKIGAGLYHLTQPKESFFDDDNKLPLRVVVHADGRFGGTRFGVEPKVLFQTQAKAMELVGGLLFNIGIVRKASLYLGGDVRVDGGVDGIGLDSGNAIVGLRLDDWDVGFSYDFNISDLRNATDLRGAIEFSLLKIFRGPTFKVEPILPAIRYN